MPSIYIPSFVGICNAACSPVHSTHTKPNVFIYTTCKAVKVVGHWLLKVTGGVREGGWGMLHGRPMQWFTMAVLASVCAQDAWYGVLVSLPYPPGKSAVVL